MVPLIWLGANSDPAPVTTSPEVPRSLVVDSVPLYSLGQRFSRLLPVGRVKLA